MPLRRVQTVLPDEVVEFARSPTYRSNSGWPGWRRSWDPSSPRFHDHAGLRTVPPACGLPRTQPRQAVALPVTATTFSAPACRSQPSTRTESTPPKTPPPRASASGESLHLFQFLLRCHNRSGLATSWIIIWFSGPVPIMENQGLDEGRGEGLGIGNEGWAAFSEVGSRFRAIDAAGWISDGSASFCG